ncbi:MAG: GNAT family N-acetyltransferase [Pirellulaceae bacterium]|nr:GNAT family N-acetyltransferase [Pirellulaceae bacterium]MDP7014785.1 GNAT family N-acetyltransferase [Pirellulaceae bacterium]
MQCDPLAALTADDRAAWTRIQRDRICVANAFSSPALASVVETLRGGVHVVHGKDAAGRRGFLPFVKSGSSGAPLAAEVSEVQCVVCEEGFAPSAQDLLKAMGVSRFRFDSGQAEQPCFEESAIRRSESSFIDIADGYADLRKLLRGRGGRFLTQVERKARRLRRRYADVQFEFACQDIDTLELLVDWKTRQHVRTGTTPVLRDELPRQLLRRLLTVESAEFRGVLSRLRVDGRTIAAHFGLQSHGVLSWWFPAYDPLASAESPGSILLLHILQAAAEQGVARIELGQGGERYKRQLRTSASAVVEGAMTCNSWEPIAHRAWASAREWAESSRIARRPLALFRRWKGIGGRRRRREVNHDSS